MARIKSWAKFQHFKDRRPPWIKLYRDLLDDKEWHKLDDKAAKLLVSLWLIASEYEGELPDIETLAFRTRLSEKDINTCLSKLSHWLEQDDIAAISTRHQSVPVADQSNTATDVSNHQERETERETEKREMRATRLPKDFVPTPEPEAEQGIDRATELANFRDYWTAKPGKDGTKLDWQATWRTWARRAHRKPGDMRSVTVPTNPAAIFKPAPQLTPEQLEANRKRGAEALAKLKAGGLRIGAH